MAVRINKDHIDKFYDNDINLDTRTVTIFGEIDELVSSRVLKGLHLLAASSSDRPITVYINSRGGDWWEGMAIYDFLVELPNHVTGIVYGMASSMASIILQGTDLRLASPHSTIMVHHGQFGGEAHTIDNERWAEYSKRMRKQMSDIYALRSGRRSTYWQRKCMHDYIMTPEEAIEEGLLDAIQVNSLD